MPRRDISYLTDILEASKLIASFVHNIDKKSFDESPLIQSAVIRQLEIIGEAVKRISGDYKKAHPDIPWRGMAGMRDILIHAYDHVDTDEVWNAATQAIPDIMGRMESLIRSENDSI